MLEERYRAQFHQLLKTLDCHVEIPAEWGSDFFDAQGPASTQWEDQRRFVRHHFRTKCVLEIKPSLPSVPRDAAFYAVYTRDVSRSGIGFLHVEELFPGEQCRLWLPTQQLPIVVSHCRRLNARCFLVGAQSARSESPASEQRERQRRVLQRIRGEG